MRAEHGILEYRIIILSHIVLPKSARKKMPMQLGVMQAMFWCFSGSNSIKIPMVMVLA
jgi:hypothetical protein